MRLLCFTGMQNTTWSGVGRGEREREVRSEREGGKKRERERERDTSVGIIFTVRGKSMK